MTIESVGNTVDLRETIQLFGTTNTRITDCKGNIALSGSHSNFIVHNELSEVGSTANYDSAVIKLTTSNNNSIAQNSILASNCVGISLIGSSYNNIEANYVVTSGSGQAGIRLETLQESPAEYNYIHGNSITSRDNGLYFRMGASNNSVFSNNITSCKNGIMLSSSFNNSFIGNNISDSTQYAVYLYISDDNSFYQNNFMNNAKQAYESHELYYWAIGNNTYYSEHNTWDNGKEGNYWSDYTGSDTDGDGIGETPYVVYENFTDLYPLTAPFKINNVIVNFMEWVPMNLPDVSSSRTPLPTINTGEESTQTEPFPTVLIAVVSVVAVALVVAGLLVYHKKHKKRETNTPEIK